VSFTHFHHVSDTVAFKAVSSAARGGFIQVSDESTISQLIRYTEPKLLRYRMKKELEDRTEPKITAITEVMSMSEATNCIR
jgi:hypothetical protein